MPEEAQLRSKLNEKRDRAKEEIAKAKLAQDSWMSRKTKVEDTPMPPKDPDQSEAELGKYKPLAHLLIYEPHGISEYINLTFVEIALMEEYKKLVSTFCASGAESYLLPSMNGYIRRQFYMSVKPEFSGSCQFLSAKNEANEQCIKVIKTTMTDDELKLQMMEEEFKVKCTTCLIAMSECNL